LPLGVNFINVKRGILHTNVLSYVHQSQNLTRKAAKKTFVQKICAFNIDEIDARCRCLQHFMSSFFANMLSPKKIYTQTKSSLIVWKCYVLLFFYLQFVSLKVFGEINSGGNIYWASFGNFVRFWLLSALYPWYL